jgi:hypothetical protein
MAKQQFQPNSRVRQVFEDLEKYLEFCVEYGYRYNEAELYNQRSYVYRQYTKLMSGKPVKNQWIENSRPQHA